MTGPGSTDPPFRAVLFICTGNYYRSRFAEAVFSHHAEARGLSWRAFSRGLRLKPEHGPLSSIVSEALDIRGIDRRQTAPDRELLTVADLRHADRRIALNEPEHRFRLAEMAPGWEARVEYWHIPDVDVADPEVALPLLEAQVLRLVDELA